MHRFIRILLALTLCVHTFASAQKEGSSISLKIVDKITNKPISEAVCQVISAEGKTVDFAFSNAQGLVTLKWRSPHSVTVSLMGYDGLTIPHNQINATGLNVARLTGKAIELKEVEVRVPPIRSKRDTLVYDVASFAHQSDKYLEDVLKKLPGINVSEEGVVYFQGKAINNFYIEGQDLLNNQYTLATKNLPVNAVSNVEVLQNHEHIKMLKNQAGSDKVALNIRIDKKSQLKPFGEVEVGLGFDPTQWNNRVFLTLINGKNQTLLLGQMNRRGDNLQSYINQPIHAQNLGVLIFPPSSILSSNLLPAIPIHSKRYQQNNSKIISVNNSTPVSENASIKSNIILYGNHNNQSTSYDARWGQIAPTIIQREDQWTNRTKRIVPSITYELNDDNLFLSNKTTYSFRQDQQNQHIQENGGVFKEKTHVTPQFVENIFNTTKKVKGKTIQIQSNTQYGSVNDRLRVDTLTPFINAKYQQQSIETKNQISSYWTLRKQTLKLSLRADYRNTLFQYDSPIRLQLLSVGIDPTYTIHYNTKGQITASLPIVWERFNISSNTAQKRSRVLPSPSLNIQHTLSNMIKLRASSSFYKSTYTASFLATSPLRESYRLTRIPTDAIMPTQQTLSQITAEYQNIYSMLFLKISAKHLLQKKQFITNSTYQERVTRVEIVPQHHNRQNWGIVANASKSFINLGFSIKVDASFQQTRYNIMQKGELLRNKANIWQISVTPNYQPSSQIKLSINAKASQSQYSSKQYGREPSLLSARIASSLTWTPSSKYEIALSHDKYINETRPSQYTNIDLLDLNTSIKIHRRLSIQISCNNILNSKNYAITYFDGINSNAYITPLRKREVMISAKFNI